MQIYTPTSQHEDEEVESLHEEMAQKRTKPNYDIIIGDSNSVIRKQQDPHHFYTSLYLLMFFGLIHYFFPG